LSAYTVGKTCFWILADFSSTRAGIETSGFHMKQTVLKRFVSI